MLQVIKGTFRNSDYFLLFLIVILGCISFFSIYSGVYDISTDSVQAHPYKQLSVFLFGISLFFIIPMFSYMRIMKFALPLYIFGCLLLVAVLVFGKIGMGAQRWLVVGPFRGQPSEFFKIIWVIMLGRMFMDMRAGSLNLLDLVKKILWLLPPVVLVFLQPDLGTSLTFVAVWGIVMCFMGVKRKIVIFALVIAAVSMPIMWGQLKPYQKMRVFAFANPEKYAGSSGYQAIQSKIAIGSGGITGKGYLKGTQSHLRFMPERHTDFIYAVINEEFGIIGGGIVLVVFFLLIAKILINAMQLKEAQGKIMSIGVAGFIIFQLYVNVSMTIGIAPVVGIPLPFISYGGSSLITFMVMIGLVNSAHVARFEKNV